MDKENREFFTDLNTTKRPININKITLNDIIEAYDELARKYIAFIKKQEYTENGEKSKLLKRKFDRLYMYWIDPFNIALRNLIGSTGVPKIEVTKITTDYGNNATLSPETIKKIRKKYNLDMERENYNITSKEDLIQILKNILRVGEKTPDKKQDSTMPKDEKNISYEKTSEISKKYKVNSNEELINLIIDQLGDKISKDQSDNEDSVLQDELRRVETYIFYTGAAEQVQSFINKYALTLEYNNKKCTKEIYGDINLKRFYTDNMYKRIVLETIEDLEIQNYRDRQNNKYIGSFKSFIRNGKIEWEQILSEGEQDAVDKVEKADKLAKQEKKSRSNEGVFR